MSSFYNVPMSEVIETHGEPDGFACEEFSDHHQCDSSFCEPDWHHALPAFRPLSGSCSAVTGAGGDPHYQHHTCGSVNPQLQRLCACEIPTGVGHCPTIYASRHNSPRLTFCRLVFGLLCQTQTRAHLSDHTTIPHLTPRHITPR